MDMIEIDDSDLVRTGIVGLDEVLFGGVCRHNNVLVEGGPGTGKTTLGLQFVHAGAALHDEPGLVLSFELEPSKLLRDARGFGFDLQALIDAGKLAIVHTSPGVLLDELHLGDGVLAERLRSLGARRLLIDGLTPLQLHTRELDLPYRERLHSLTQGLVRLGVTTMVTREADERGMRGLTSDHERFVFDTIITLEREDRRAAERRSLMVVKSRGQDFVTGRHTLRFVSGKGLEVYRRAHSRRALDVPQPSSSERVTTGCAGLDELMDGGLFRGSVTMLIGISGTGKTVAGLQFLVAATQAGRRALMVTLDEQPQQLYRNAATIGFDLPELEREGLLFLHYESPLELELDVHFERIVRLVERENIDCVVFDSVAVYEHSFRTSAPDFLHALAGFFKQRLATVYFSYESPELLGISQISQSLKASHVVDNIVLLSYVEISALLRRAIVVPKMRGSNNRRVTREFTIGQGGLTLVAESAEADELAVPQLPFSAYYGLLARSPSRRSPVIDEAVSHGDALPESSAEVDDGR